MYKWYGKVLTALLAVLIAMQAAAGSLTGTGRVMAAKKAGSIIRSAGVAAGDSIEVRMYNLTRSPDSNEIDPYIRIYNNGASALQLKNVKVRYYFTVDVERELKFTCDWADKSKTKNGNDKLNDSVTGTFAKMETFKQGADHYLEIGFTPDMGALQREEYVELRCRFYRDDWSSFSQPNDYSFRESGEDYDVWDKMTGYINEALIFGVEPSADLEAYPENRDIKIQMYNSNKSEIVNTVSPRIKIVNTGVERLDFEDIKFRYYFTINGEKTQRMVCDYAAVDGWHSDEIKLNKIRYNFVKLEDPVGNADYYLEVGFDKGAGSFGMGGSLQLDLRFYKSDWSDYKQSDDYSFRNGSESDYADWEKATGYIGDTLVWGEEPGAAPAAPTNLSASAESGGIALSWSASPDAQTYSIYRRSSDQSGYDTGNPLATGLTSLYYLDTTAEAGAGYYYVVTAVNGDGESGFSNEASVLIALSVIPILESLVLNQDGTATAVFGWNNYNSSVITVPAADSVFEGTVAGGAASPARTFAAGRVYNAFSTTFSGDKLVWKLKGPDGSTLRVAAAADKAGSPPSFNPFDSENMVYKLKTDPTDPGDPADPGSGEVQDYQKFALGEYVPLLVDFNLIAKARDPVFDFNYMLKDLEGRNTGFTVEKLKSAGKLEVEVYINGTKLDRSCIVEEPAESEDENENNYRMRFKVLGNFERGTKFSMSCIVKVSATDELFDSGIENSYNLKNILYFRVLRWLDPDLTARDPQGELCGPSDDFPVLIVVVDPNIME